MIQRFNILKYGLLPLSFLGFAYFQLSGTNSSDSTNLVIGKSYFEKAISFFQIDFDSCIFYLNEALPIFNAAESWEYYVNCYNGLYGSYYYLGKYGEAEKFALNALDNAEKYLEEGNETRSDAFNNLGTLYSQKKKL